MAHAHAPARPPGTSEELMTTIAVFWLFSMPASSVVLGKAQAFMAEAARLRLCPRARGHAFAKAEMHSSNIVLQNFSGDATGRSARNSSRG